MKKHFLGLIAIVFINYNVSAQNSTNTENLYALNDVSYSNFNVQNQNTMVKKKWWQVIGQVCAVVSGDAAGAAGGVWAAQGVAGIAGAATAGTGYAVVATGAAVVGAVGGSYAAYCSTGGHCRGSLNNTNPEGNPKTYDFINEFDYLENLGTLHNNGLQNIYLSDNLIPEKNWLLNNIPNIELINFDKLYNSDEFNKLKNDIKQASTNFRNSNYDYTVLLREYKSKNLFDDVVYNTLNNYFSEISKIETYNDFVKITDRYVINVQNSKDTTHEKEALLASFSTSINSFYFWYNFETNE